MTLSKPLWILSPPRAIYASPTAARGTQITQAHCDEFDLLVTKTPAPPMNPNAWRMAAAALKRADHAAEIVVIGDSIAAAFPRAMAARALGRQSVCNLGVNGLRTQNVLWLLEALTAAPMRPLDVMVLVGTNNLSAGDKPGAIAAGTWRIIERAEELWTPQRIVFIQTVPRVPDQDLRAADRQELHRLMDLHPSDHSNLIIVNADTALGGKRSAYNADDLHLLPFGYDLIAHAIHYALQNSR